MRSLVPTFLTLPSRTAETFSFRPISAMSALFPLNAKDDVRDATRSDWILVRALMISSAIPSAKYSLSGSALMFANARTATDFAAETVGRRVGYLVMGAAIAPDPIAWANNAVLE